MGVALPDASVVGYDRLIGTIDLPDLDDRHVVAAAIVAGADIIVTANLGDFPTSSLPAGVAALSPDDFVDSLIRADLDAVVTVIDAQAASLRNPPMTTIELLDGLEVVGLVRSALALRRALT